MKIERMEYSLSFDYRCHSSLKKKKRSNRKDEIRKKRALPFDRRNHFVKMTLRDAKLPVEENSRKFREADKTK